MMKIEVGKYYRTKNGMKAGPAIDRGVDVGEYRFLLAVHYSNGTVRDYTFTDDGKWFLDRVDDIDLIEEWQDPVAETVPEKTTQDVFNDIMSHPGKIVRPSFFRLGVPYIKIGDDEFEIPMSALRNLSEPEPDVSDHPYRPLQVVLDEAFHQAAHGKGRERHANDRDFIDQPIMEIGRMCGPGFNTGQAMKKIQEAMGMLSRGQDDAAIRELLGAINYTAAAVILIRERPGYAPSTGQPS